jgi:hypothetical protein
MNPTLADLQAQQIKLTAQIADLQRADDLAATNAAIAALRAAGPHIFITDVDGGEHGGHSETVENPADFEARVSSTSARLMAEHQARWNPAPTEES